ncbi:MAG: Methyltransferase type 11 [Frankiales bacterium]|nr:Methyltransferase type 11 [Frankiales bacterium]
MSAMDAEFDTVASWTAEVALSLGPEFYLPAGCRGSGSPATLNWFTEQLDLQAADRMLDCGAGVGGPAEFASRHKGVEGVAPILTDPQAGACRAARLLFGLPTVQSASDLPFRTGSFDVAWSLGVLCTVTDQAHLLAELRRVLTPTGRLGLLVFVAAQPWLPDAPEGNDFPTQEGLRSLLAGAGFDVRTLVSAIDLGANPPSWTARVAAVEAELERRHGDDPRWLEAEQQSDKMGALLASGAVLATAVIAQSHRS